MLDAYIIDKIKKEQEEGTEIGVPLHIDVPLVPDEQDSDSIDDVVIIDNNPDEKPPGDVDYSVIYSGQEKYN